MKNIKIHYVLNGIKENPCTRITKKGSRQQIPRFATYSFSLHLKDMISPYTRKTKARDTRRGPPGSTIIIYKEIIRFNNNNNNNHYPTIPWDGISRQGAPLGDGFLPHFVGGIQHLKSLLLSPYPAIPPYVVKTPHPGSTDDREHITRQSIEKERERERGLAGWLVGWLAGRQAGWLTGWLAGWLEPR